MLGVSQYIGNFGVIQGVLSSNLKFPATQYHKGFQQSIPNGLFYLA